MMYGVMTLYEASFPYYQMTTNSAVNRKLAPVVNNWNNSSKCLRTNKVIYIFCMIIQLLTWFNIKITDTRFNFTGG